MVPQSLSRLPHSLVEALQASVQAVRTVILRQLVLDAVQNKPGVADSIGVAADECAKERVVGEVAVQTVETEDDIRSFPLPVGHHYRNHPAAVVRDLDLHAAAVRERVHINCLSVGHRSEGGLLHGRISPLSRPFKYAHDA